MKAYFMHLTLELLKGALLAMLTLLVREVTSFLRGGGCYPEEAWQ